MNKKMNLVSVLLMVFIGMVLLVGLTSCSKKDGELGGSKSVAGSSAPKREADGQYRIGSEVKVYDGDFKPTADYFTYLPRNSGNTDWDHAVILNFAHESVLYLGRAKEGVLNTIDYVRNCIDKSIEWAATAKENNVHSLIKEIPTDGYNYYDLEGMKGLKTNRNSFEPVALTFTFFIGDIDEDSKEETVLAMIWQTRNDVLSGRKQHFFFFHENDFARLKEMFSESYLAEIDKQEAARQESHAEQDALFE
jgi:hypothetical protein